MKRGFGIFWLLVISTSCLHAQQADSILSATNKLSDKYTGAIARKADKVSGQIDKQTEKYLARLEKQEEKLKRRLRKIDSLAANKIFADAKHQYSQLKE